MVKEDKIRELEQIIEDKKLRTHFQPIISLKTGKILGYEALTRGPEDNLYLSPNRLFADAKCFNMLFELEKLAREKALFHARQLDPQYKLFINVDPCVICDKNFTGGFTRDLINKISLLQSNIVIELTEKTMVNDFHIFKNALEHYKKEGFKLAIDDTGAGYSGLGSIVSIYFDYIKIDHSLIANIDQNPVKQALLEALVIFAGQINSQIIAEGVEQLAELDVLIKLGIDYGQGFLIAPPVDYFQNSLPIADYIKKLNNLKSQYYCSQLIGKIAKPGVTLTADTETEQAVQIFEQTNLMHSITIIKDKKPVGLVMRDKLYYRLGKKFGYAVFMDRPLQLIMDPEPMIVNYNTPISEVARQAMARKQDSVYDCIIVFLEGDYYGIVSIQTLLAQVSKMQIEEAKQLNPLTNLPGNPVIKKEIRQRLQNKESICVLYLDLDNFKAYNDRYGYQKGDEVIKFTARTLTQALWCQGTKADFVGHIGGDDFVVITSSIAHGEEISQHIINSFDRGIVDYYEQKDLVNGYILTENRSGRKCMLPIIAISIALISNQNDDVNSPLQISDLAAELKKLAKSQPGSLLVRDRRKRKKNREQLPINFNFFSI